MSENLIVAKDVVVGLAYTLYVENAVEDSAPAADPLEYLHGHGNLISGLEKALEGMKVGETKKSSWNLKKRTANMIRKM